MSPPWVPSVDNPDDEEQHCIECDELFVSNDDIPYCPYCGHTVNADD